jgi:hypothetical protein
MADPKLTFTLRLATKPKTPFVIVAGGADVNHDGDVSNKDEVAAFEKTGADVWERTQPYTGNATGMLFAVTFTVGGGVKWELVIKDETGKVRFRGGNTTTLPFDTVAFTLD